MIQRLNAIYWSIWIGILSFLFLYRIMEGEIKYNRLPDEHKNISIFIGWMALLLPVVIIADILYTAFGR